MLVDGELGIDQIHPDRLSDPEIIDLGRRVRTHVDANIQALFPAECLARVTIRLKDGRGLEGPTLGARGDYTAPLTEEEMIRKFEAMVTRTLGERNCVRLCSVLDSLDTRPADDLIELLFMQGKA